MSKYDPLQRYLSNLDGDEWRAEFVEIEKILGFSLPASAAEYPAWWANQEGSGHSQKQGWQRAGWQTFDVDLKARRIGFRRVRRTLPSYETPAVEQERLYEDARRFLGIETQEELVREGVKALIEREAARHLAALGGTMPEFVPPPRPRAE